MYAATQKNNRRDLGDWFKYTCAETHPRWRAILKLSNGDFRPLSDPLPIKWPLPWSEESWVISRFWRPKGPARDFVGEECGAGEEDQDGPCFGRLDLLFPAPWSGQSASSTVRSDVYEQDRHEMHVNYENVR